MTRAGAWQAQSLGALDQVGDIDAFKPLGDVICKIFPQSARELLRADRSRRAFLGVLH